LSQRGGRVGGLCPRVDCGHESCARERLEHASPCSICGEPIGDNSSYTVEPESEADFAPNIITHTLCAAKAGLSVTKKEHYP
jgi:hypothetical protein